MAISKERLEELIKEGATIYTIKHNGGDVVELCLKNISDEFWYFLLGIAEELFENKAEVEEKAEKIKWVLKYHSTRTEELDLPMWEELPLVFEKSFVTRNSAYYLSSSKPQDNISLIKYKNIMLFPCLDMGLEQIYVGRLTEENYIKACDLCLKLFKGE